MTVYQQAVECDQRYQLVMKSQIDCGEVTLHLRSSDEANFDAYLGAAKSDYGMPVVLARGAAGTGWKIFVVGSYQAHWRLAYNSHRKENDMGRLENQVSTRR